MRSALALGVCIALLVGPSLAWAPESVRVRPDYFDGVSPHRSDLSVSCLQSYYYLLEHCAYVTVVEGIEEGESFGVHFVMSETVPWHTACDTNACLTLDGVELVLYDVLPPPTDQSMNVKVFGANASGEPVGGLLGNRDFVPGYADTAVFTSVAIDFTNGGSEQGLDLSGCSGCYVVILTWKNTSGHPLLVLDNISTCVDSCVSNPDCCEMGGYPYVYPRDRTHTYYYGTEWAWSKQDSFCDMGGCGTYGCLEALWESGFCTVSAATKPATWGTIKAIYH